MRSNAFSPLRSFQIAVKVVLSRTTIALALALPLASAVSAHSATLCVNPKTPTTCWTTIGSAVAAAKSGDTVLVSPGTYKEDVIIGKSISLLGDATTHPTIDATGLANGIYIDGLDNPGLAEVTVGRFTVKNANFEGILAQNVSRATIVRNTVTSNNLSLVVLSDTCPGLPAFETNETMDCGEGIHLMGVSNSVIAQNTVFQNSGGILVSDETAMTTQNTITHNTVHDNPYACGITLASHAGYVKTGKAPLAFGVEHNIVSENQSFHNGEGLPGAGAGIGLYAPGPGNINVYNSIVNNTVTNNGLSGIALHNHVDLTFPGHPPNPILANNTITGNFISGNAGDIDLGLTVPTGISILGTTPVSGMVIVDNTIENESIDIAIDSASLVDVHFNTLTGGGTGVDVLNAAGSVNASSNWWGCAAGPGASGCTTTSTAAGATIVATPWLDGPVVP
jgi:parallel beta-helix repeat protein